MVFTEISEQYKDQKTKINVFNQIEYWKYNSSAIKINSTETVLSNNYSYTADIKDAVFPYSFTGKNLKVYLLIKVLIYNPENDDYDIIREKYCIPNQTYSGNFEEHDNLRKVLRRRNYFRLFFSMHPIWIFFALTWIILWFWFLFWKLTENILSHFSLGGKNMYTFLNSDISIGIWLYILILFTAGLLWRFYFFHKFYFALTSPIRRWESYNMNTLLRGSSKLNLHNLKIEIVARNIAVYPGKDNTIRKTESKYIISEHTIDFLPKNTEISNYLWWNIDFEKLYSKSVFPSSNPLAIETLYGTGGSIKGKKVWRYFVWIDFDLSIEMRDSLHLINKKITIPNSYIDFTQFDSYKKFHEQ